MHIINQQLQCNGRYYTNRYKNVLHDTPKDMISIKCFDDEICLSNATFKWLQLLIKTVCVYYNINLACNFRVNQAFCSDR